MFKNKTTRTLMIISICLLAVLVVISVPLVKKVRKQMSVNGEISELEKEIERLKSQRSDLKGVISYLQTDQYVKEKAKEDLNYREPGETVVVVKKEVVNQIDSGSETDKDKQLAMTNNAVKWWYYFFK